MIKQNLVSEIPFHGPTSFVKLSIILVFLLLIITATVYQEGFSSRVTYCQAKDGNYYLVRNLKDKRRAANLLAKMNGRVKYLLKHLRKKHYNNRDIIRLCRNYNEHQLSEATKDSQHTSYSINKGEKIVFCLRHRHEDQREHLTDINTMMFVAIHELAHLMSSSIGHTPEFWRNMRFLLREAEKCPRKIYEYIPYHLEPVRYCGTLITDTPYRKE